MSDKYQYLYVNNGTVIILMIDNAANIIPALIGSPSRLDFMTSTTSNTMTGATVNEVTMQPNLVKEPHIASSSNCRASPIFFKKASFHACSLIV